MTRHPAHHHLLELGFEHRTIPADWEDTGNAESGPCLSGHESYEQYELGDMTVYIGNDGETGFDIWDIKTGFPLASHY